MKNVRKMLNKIGPRIDPWGTPKSILDELSYTELINRISKEESRRKVKRPRQRKGPRMVNRRDNCNTQKVNMYRFTQSSFQQNRRVTIDQILKGTLG